jgi:hypothetical protein
MYVSRPLLFIGIGLLTIPISFVVALLQSGVVRAGTLAGVDPGGEDGGIRVSVVVGLSTLLTLFGIAFVFAACTRAIAEIDAGREVDVRRAYRMALGSALPVFGALGIAIVVVTLLGLSLFLIPLAVWLVVRWALLVPAAELEGCSALGALRRSGSLVRRQWLKVASLVIAAALLAILAGPLLGALLLLLVDLPFGVVNVVAGIVYAVAMPFVAATTTYVYYDTLVRERLDTSSGAPDELPAEISI